jgi:purine-binding chemotaxis protein CheW
MSGVHLRVAVGAESYAVPIGEVLEVAELGDVVRLPGTPGAVAGVRNLRGRVLPVIDLAGLLEVPREAPPSRLVIAERDGCVAGLAVDSVSAVEALPEASEEVASPHLSGAALVDGTLVGTIDVAAVFESVRTGQGRA